MPIKGEMTKLRIVKTARDLFYMKGYNNTSIEDILKAGKVKKGNLYFHFKSKEELGYAVIDSCLADEHKTMELIFRGRGSPLQRIYRLFDLSKKKLSDGGCRGGCPIGNFAIEMSDIHNGFRKRISAVFESWTDQFERLLEEAKRMGELPGKTDSRALASFVVALWEGGVMLVKTRKDPQVLGDCVRSLKGILASYRA